MKKLLIIFFTITSLSYSQTFQLGFRMESTYENTTAGSVFGYFPFGHFYITSGLTERSVPILNDLTEEFRLGGMIAPSDMSGFDFSFNLKTHLYKKYLYVSGGIDFHHDVGSSGYPSINYEKTLEMLVLGIGYSPDNIVYIELSQYIPLSNPSLGGGYFGMDQYKLNYLTAIGFGINFKL